MRGREGGRSEIENTRERGRKSAEGGRGTQAHIQTHAKTHMDTHTNTRTHVRTHTHTHTHTRTHTHTHARLLPLYADEAAPLQPHHVRVLPHTHTHTHTHTHQTETETETETETGTETETDRDRDTVTGAMVPLLACSLARSQIVCLPVPPSAHLPFSFPSLPPSLPL